jgi:cobalt/nickel transport system permease protein
MHMADALLSPTVGATFWVGTIAAIGYASKKLKESIDDRVIPLMGVLGAFIFAAQMINFTIPGTGSSGHIGGGMILTVLLGPYAAFLVIASVLTVQAMFFADGGLLALGCNIWNLGIYPCFIAFPFIYKPLAGDGKNSKKILVAALVSGIVGLQMGAFSVVLQTVLSGKSELPFGTFVMVMQPIHLGIGIVEGLVTAGVINYVRSTRPEILESVVNARPLESGVSMKKVLVALSVLAITTGGMLSWFASSNPDGLEWSIEKVFGRPELPEQERGIASVMKDVQEKTALLPDYKFKPASPEEERKETEPVWPGIDPGTSVSGLVGAVMVLGLALLIGLGIKRMRKRRS